jgi:hypothetical protein
MTSGGYKNIILHSSFTVKKLSSDIKHTHLSLSLSFFMKNISLQIDVKIAGVLA